MPYKIKLLYLSNLKLLAAFFYNKFKKYYGHHTYELKNNRNKCSRIDEYRYEKANPSLFVKRLSSFRVNVLSRKKELHLHML